MAETLFSFFFYKLPCYIPPKQLLEGAYEYGNQLSDCIIQARLFLWFDHVARGAKYDTTLAHVKWRTQCYPPETVTPPRLRHCFASPSISRPPPFFFFLKDKVWVQNPVQLGRLLRNQTISGQCSTLSGLESESPFLWKYLEMLSCISVFYT